jgi:large subunit ribosomal protein L18
MPKPLVIQYRRKRAGLTDYRKRLVMLKSGLARLVVRGSNRGIQVQLVRYAADGDVVLATARATDLKKLGWSGALGNTPAAYLTGLLLAHKAGTKANGDVILDIGLQSHHKGGRLYAAVKGAIDGGLAVRVGEDVMPSEERLSGSHIDEGLAKQLEAVKQKIRK